ncbi:MAG: hypothetical protein WCL29_03635 [Pseudomonadota bacterium]
MDQRLVRDRHLEQLDVVAAALYLFLVTVADAKGLSWYGDASMARLLSIDGERLRRARGDLVRAGLLAYARPLYQVLALGDPPTSRSDVARSEAPEMSAAPVSTRAMVREHLAALHAALGQRP